jgi:hypothetical protein
MTDGHEVEDDFREVADGKFARDDLSTAHPENQWSAEPIEELRPGHAACPVIHGAKQRVQIGLFAFAELADFGLFACKGLYDTDSRNVLLDDGGHGPVEIMDVPPLRLKFACVESDERNGRQHCSQCNRAKPGTDEKGQCGCGNQGNGDVHGQQQAREKEILKPPDVCSGAGDEFAGVGAIVIGESKALKRVVNRGADVTQGALDDPVANRAKGEANDHPDRDESEKQENKRPNSEGNASGDVLAESCDGVAEDLRQRHFDRDVDEQQADATRDLPGVGPEKSQNPQQISRLETVFLFVRCGHQTQALAESRLPPARGSRGGRLKGWKSEISNGKSLELPWLEDLASADVQGVVHEGAQ